MAALGCAFQRTSITTSIGGFIWYIDLEIISCAALDAPCMITTMTSGRLFQCRLRRHTMRMTILCCWLAETRWISRYMFPVWVVVWPICRLLSLLETGFESSMTSAALAETSWPDMTACPPRRNIPQVKEPFQKWCPSWLRLQMATASCLSFLLDALHRATLNGAPRADAIIPTQIMKTATWSMRVVPLSQT